MPIKTDVWTVGLAPNKLRQSRLASEQLLEEMIISSPSILSDEWMLIGRQENTGMGGRIDLLAIAPDGNLVLIELKRDRTPREANNLKGFHELRAAYACERYEQITHHPAPINGGK